MHPAQPSGDVLRGDPLVEHEQEAREMDGDGLGAAALRHAGVLRGVGVDGRAVDAAVPRVGVLAREQLAGQSPARRRGADVAVGRSGELRQLGAASWAPLGLHGAHSSVLIRP